MTMNDLDRWANADFNIPSRDEDEPLYRNLPYSRYVNRPQEMTSNKTNYTKYDVIFNPPATIALWADGT